MSTQTHGTALTEGQFAEFMGNGSKALALIAGKLGSQRARYWDGKSELMQERMLKALMPSLLEHIGTITLPMTTDQFIARDQLAVGVNGITYVGENFKEWFVPKVESPGVGITLHYAKLLEASLDAPIIEELGNTTETMLAHIAALIKCQKTGKSGVLLTNGYANIFYVKDVMGVLRAVYVYWFGGGWGVLADSLSFPSRWDDGYRVFSCNS